VSGWEVAYRDDAEVAERPLWDAATGSLVWVDITGGLVHRLEIPGRHSKVAVSAPVGAAALRSRGGLVIAHDSELLFVAPDGTPDRAAVPFSHPPNIRFNDGACDPAGRFLIGTSSTDGRSGQGALYSVASDGNVTELLSDVTESNGLAWSLDGQTMYYVDSAHPEIRRYRYDAATGRLGKDSPMGWSSMPTAPSGRPCGRGGRCAASRRPGRCSSGSPPRCPGRPARRSAAAGSISST
jgi:sugar lactone lactonase YvrE